MSSSECQLEEEFVYRQDIRDRTSLEKNFRKKLQPLNHVKFIAGEFQRLFKKVVTSDVFTAAHILRNRNSFVRDDGTPLNFTLVNIGGWCKNTFEVVSHLHINTDNSRHRYEVPLRQPDFISITWHPFTTPWQEAKP